MLLVKDKPWPEHPLFVVAVDPQLSNDKPADLDRLLAAAGTSLASATGGKVYLYHSCYQSSRASRSASGLEVADYRKTMANLLLQYNIAEDHLHIDERDVLASLPDLLDRLEISVLVMGVVSCSAIDRFLVGSTAEKLLDRIDQDVLIIKPDGFTDTVKKARLENL